MAALGGIFAPGQNKNEKKGKSMSLFSKFKKAANKNNKPVVMPSSSLDVDAARLSLRSLGPYHSSAIMADGVQAKQEGKFHWYRADAGGLFQEICQTDLNTYSPSIDDVACRICCQWVPKDGLPSAFCEYGPVALDPVVEQRVTEAINSNSFPIPFKALSSDKTTEFTLYLNEEDVTGLNEQKDPLFSCKYETEDLEIGLNAKNPKKLKLVSASKELLVRLYLESNVERDVFAVLFRNFNDPPTEENAQDDEETTTVEKVNSRNASRRSSRRSSQVHTGDDSDNEGADPFAVMTDNKVSDDVSVPAELDTGTSAVAAELKRLRKAFKQSELEFSRKLVEHQKEKEAMTRKSQMAYGEIAKMQGSLKELTSEVETLKADKISLQDELARQKKQATHLRKLAESLAVENEKLNDESKRSNFALQDKKMDEATIESLRDQLKSLKSLEQALDTSKKEASLLKEQLITVNGKVDTLEQRCKHLDDSNKAIFAEKIELDRQLAEITSSNTELQAARAALVEAHDQHAELKKMHTSNKTKLEAESLEIRVQLKAAEQERDELKTKLHDLEVELRAELALGQDAHSEMASQRNFYKKKAESLSQTVEKMLKEQGQDMAALRSSPKASSSSKQKAQTPTARRRSSASSANLEAQLASAREARDEAVRALDMYKKVFEEQLVQLKQEREANMLLASKNSRKGDAASQYRIQTLQALANHLSESVNDKDTALEVMRETNKALGKRVQELEARYGRSMNVSSTPLEQKRPVRERHRI